MTATLAPPAHAYITAESITYSAYVAGRGWEPGADGTTAGTTGQSLRLEALKVSGINLAYRVHVQSTGWTSYQNSGQTAGVPGSGKRLEAAQITSLDPSWKVEYRAHVQSIGWQPWVKDSIVAGTVGKALRMEAIQIRLFDVIPNHTDPITFTVTADNGLESAGLGVFSGIGKSGAGANFILGDFAYAPDRESAYCKVVTDRVNFPTELLAGNHEDDTTRDGLLTKYVKCLPDRLYEQGSYAKDYYVDRGPVRFIMISPGLLLGGVTKTYADGTPEQAWLTSLIREARLAGQWTVVGFHKPCLTLGEHGCSSSPDLTNALIREHVDLVVSGHDHNYSRSHQIKGTIANPVVMDSDSLMGRGGGTVFVVIGNGGHNPRTVKPLTSIWAAESGTNSPGGITFGYGKVTVDGDSLSFSLVRTSGGALTDGFVIDMSD
jgi:hypothetical protein